MRRNISVFLTSKTVVQPGMRAWLDHVGAKGFQVPADVTDAAAVIGVAAKRCYMSFDASLNPNLTKVRTDWAEYLDNVLSVGHGSVLEHATFTFAIEGVSRVFTAEMNRHRAGWAVSEGSLRYIRFGEGIPYWEPDCIQGGDVLDTDQLNKFHLSPQMLYRFLDGRVQTFLATAEEKRHATRLIFQRVFGSAEDWYRVLELIWAPELAPTSKFRAKKQVTSMMRRIVPMGVSTGGVWTGNVRALRHVLTMRCSPHAEEEILSVFSEVAKLMAESEPMLFGDFHRDEDGYWVPKYVKV